MDSNVKGDRTSLLARFAPYYNGSSPAELEANRQPETRVLIATDVLSEGLNLQDATFLINYDLHWNPVRLMQRIGRVDRRMTPMLKTASLGSIRSRQDSRRRPVLELPPAERARRPPPHLRHPRS